MNSFRGLSDPLSDWKICVKQTHAKYLLLEEDQEIG